jgi:hypothetical protein
MTLRRLRLRDGIDARLVDRWPLLVAFGLTIAAPLAALLLVIGFVAGQTTTIERTRHAAGDLISPDLSARYSDALFKVQSECVESSPAGGMCFEDTAATSATAVEQMKDVIAIAALTDCKRLPIPVKKAYKYDYFSCLGPPTPNAAFILVWSALAGLGGLMFLRTFATVFQARVLLPRFNPNLWITPYALGGAFLPLAPCLLAILSLRSRLPPGFGLNGSSLELWTWLLLLCSMWAAIIAADLRTFEPERVYVRGISFGIVLVSVFSVFFSIALAIVKGTGYKGQLTVLDIGILGCAVWLIVHWSRIRQARQIRQAVTRFFGRLVRISWLIVLAAVALIAYATGHPTIQNISLLNVSLGLLALSFAASPFAERSTS